jgi:hypothetical protein
MEWWELVGGGGVDMMECRGAIHYQGCCRKWLMLMTWIFITITNVSCKLMPYHSPETDVFSSYNIPWFEEHIGSGVCLCEEIHYTLHTRYCSELFWMLHSIACLECDGTSMRREAWAKGKQASGVDNPSIVKERQVIASPALLWAAEWADTPPRFEWTGPIHWKTKTSLCTIAITFQTTYSSYGLQFCCKWALLETTDICWSVGVLFHLGGERWKNQCSILHQYKCQQ